MKWLIVVISAVYVLGALAEPGHGQASGITMLIIPALNCAPIAA